MRRFIQGLGAGILIATLILTVAYYTVGKSKISDSEVIDRAKKLGMTQNTEAPLFTNQSDIEKAGNDAQNNSPQGAQPQQDGSEQPAEGAGQEGEGAHPEGEGSPQQDSGETQPVENNQPSEAAPDDSAQSQNSYTLEIKPGEEATIVARHLKDMGVINDAADFDKYLRNNSYSTRLQIGTYELKGDMSYEEIASIISK